MVHQKDSYLNKHERNLWFQHSECSVTVEYAINQDHSNLVWQQNGVSETASLYQQSHSWNHWNHPTFQLQQEGYKFSLAPSLLSTF